jgi:hypothetical protein
MLQVTEVLRMVSYVEDCMLLLGSNFKSLLHLKCMDKDIIGVLRECFSGIGV